MTVQFEATSDQGLRVTAGIRGPAGRERAAWISLQPAMIVNSRYGFVFVHVPKAAGTSVREALQSLEGTRPEWTTQSKHETLADFDRQVRERQQPRDRIFRRHPRRYFRFCFVRNPWDRLVSLHRYLLGQHAERLGLVGCTLADLLERLDRGDEAIRSLHSMRQQADFLTLPGGRMRIDFVGHFEHLGADFASILGRIGCPPLTLGHANTSAHAGQDYRPAFDERLRRIVERTFADDIRHFGYEFERAEPVRRVSGPVDRPR